MRLTDGESELRLPVSMVCNNIESRVSFSQQGIGIAYLPEFAIKGLLSDGQLRRVLANYTERAGVLYVLWPASKYPTPKVRVFIDFLHKRLITSTPSSLELPPEFQY